MDERWRDSKISCSSFGRRGGAGPPKLLNGLDEEDEDDDDDSEGGDDLEEEESPRRGRVVLSRRQWQLNRCARGAELRCRSRKVDVAVMVAGFIFGHCVPDVESTCGR